MNALTRMPNRNWGLFNDFDDIVNGFFAPVRAARSDESRLVPAMDIVENEENYEIRTDLPGVKKEDLSVSVKDNVLTIEAQSKREDVEKEGDKVIKLERRSGNYLRTLRLGNAVDEGKISAQYTDGVLKLVLPKVESATNRQIDVDVH